jgi:hypothetical protein
MDEDYVRGVIMGEMRRRNLSPEEAARQFARGLGVDFQSLNPILKRLHEEAQRNRILDTPPGVYDT